VRFMWLKRIILFSIGVFGACNSNAQLQGGELVQSRILILLDESSSMIQTWSGPKEKYKAAGDLIMRLMDSVYSVNKDVEFSLRVFGHQSTVQENNCYDTRNEVPFAKDNKIQMSLRLADIRPLGVTPIAYALTQAAEHDLVDVVHNAYSIILITDGGESCGGDICEVMKMLIKYKVYFKPYIVSLENDPGLKTTYACMGDYLQVVKESDMPVAVGTIVAAFRPVLKINTADYKELQKTAAHVPSVLKVNIPPPEDFTAITPADLQTINVTVPSLDKIRIVAKIPPLPAMVIDIPAPLPIIKIAGIAQADLKPFRIAAPQFTKVKTIANGLSLPPLVIDVPVQHIDKISRLKPINPRQFNVIFVIEDHTFALRSIPAFPPVKFDVVATRPLPPKIEAPVLPNEKQLQYRLETEDNKETTVEVYFTNGKGKFYTTMPQVLILEPSTNKVLRKFYRTVDADGNPDPQTNMPIGTYNIGFVAKRNLVIHNANILRNKKNKIIVTVNNTSLSFAYADPANPEKLSDRPVSEFSAIVTERNKTHGRVQNQKCTEALEYEPGNYHIEINTFPTDVRNVDLDFDDESVIKIAQPGYAKFTDEVKTGSVILYQTLGDKFIAFYTLNLSDPRSKHLKMQPGEYQVHYQKGPGQSYAAEQVQKFLIKATQETEVILK
jgi:hypothetical protein